MYYLFCVANNGGTTPTSMERRFSCLPSSIVSEVHTQDSGVSPTFQRNSVYCPLAHHGVTQSFCCAIQLTAILPPNLRRQAFVQDEEAALQFQIFFVMPNHEGVDRYLECSALVHEEISRICCSQASHRKTRKGQCSDFSGHTSHSPCVLSYLTSTGFTLGPLSIDKSIEAAIFASVR